MNVEKLSHEEAEKAEDFIKSHYKEDFDLYSILDEMRTDAEERDSGRVLSNWIEMAEMTAEKDGILGDGGVENAPYELQSILKAVRVFEKEKSLESQLTTSKYIKILARGEMTTIKQALDEDHVSIAATRASGLKELLGFYQSLR